MRHDTIPESAENTNPDMSSSDNKIIDGIIADLRTTVDQVAIDFNTAKNLILELARRFDETKRCKQSQICGKIKEILRNKIKEGKITEKQIEECVPEEYKRRYAKSQVISLSKQVKRYAAAEQPKNKDIIAAHTQRAKSVLTTIDGRNDSHDSHFHNDQIESGPNKEVINQEITSEDDNKYEAICLENYELKQAVKRLTSIVTADKISASEIEFTIRKSRFEEVKAAMESSRDSISVTFDKSGTLQRAEPDIFR